MIKTIKWKYKDYIDRNSKTGVRDIKSGLMTYAEFLDDLDSNCLHITPEHAGVVQQLILQAVQDKLPNKYKNN